MPERWIGVVVGSDKVTVVDAEVPPSGPLTIQMDDTWPLQRGPRAAAYHVMHQRVADYVREHGVERVVIKESATSQRPATKGHLEAAELRGAVMCAAAASGAIAQTIAKALISRTFGQRKVDEYLEDDGFWAKEVGGKLRIGSREAAMVLLAARKKAP